MQVRTPPQLLTIAEALHLLPVTDAMELLWSLLEQGRHRGRRRERLPLEYALAVARGEMYYSEAARRYEERQGLSTKSAERAISRALHEITRYMPRVQRTRCSQYYRRRQQISYT